MAAGRIADGAAFLPIQSSTIWVTKPTSAKISEIAPSRNPLILSFPRRDTTLSYCPERMKGYQSRKMKIGLLMLGDAPVQVMLERARLAEAVGYDTVWVADERFYREVYSCLTHFADYTSKVLLGPA